MTLTILFIATYLIVGFILASIDCKYHPFEDYRCLNDYASLDNLILVWLLWPLLILAYVLLFICIIIDKYINWLSS